MERQLTRSQKRNKRRTANRRAKKTNHNKPLYNVGDTVIVESHDRDDYLMEDNNWTYKGFIEKVYTYLGGLYVYYIIRTETPVSFESCINHVDTKIWPAAKDNCTFSRKRYGEKFLDIIACKENINRDYAVKCVEDYVDYTSVCQIDDYGRHKTFLRVFPSSKYRPTLRECLYNFWFVERHSAVGLCSIITDPIIRKEFMTRNIRWTFDYGTDDTVLYELKLSVCSEKVNLYSKCIAPYFQQQPDIQYPFVDCFEEFEYVSSPFTSSNYSKNMINAPVLVEFELVYDCYDIAIAQVKKWRVIPKELYDIYLLISTTRDPNPKETGCIFDKYLNCTYKELPDKIRTICDNLMWPRDRIFDVKTVKDNYYVNRTYLEEISSL